MSVVIDGNNGVSGNNGTAATPTLRGDDPDTGVFFPSANTVAVSTGGVEQVRVANGGATIRGGVMTLGDPTFPGVFPYLSFDPGSGFTGAIEFLGDMTLYSFGPSGTYRSITMWSANTLFRDGTAAAPTIAAFSDNNTGIFFPAADTIAFAEGGVERLRIADAGQIGIGGANYGTSGQVLTSGGPSAAPSWATVNTNSYTLLGTLTTTSGNTQTLSGLTLTSYRNLYIEVRDVSTSSSTSILRLDGRDVGEALQSANNRWLGIMTVDLGAGTYSANIARVVGDQNFNAAVPYAGDLTITSASTSLSFTTSAGNFDAGSILVYGVR
jgi:hypothetical protein